MPFLYDHNFEILPGLRLTRLIGKQPLSEVWEATDEDESGKAIKLVKREAPFPSNWSGPALKKIKAIRHPYILGIEKIFVHEGNVAILQELAEYHVGHIYQINKGIPRQELLKYLAEAAEVLDFLHTKHQLVHGAVKPANLCVIHNHIKLTDAGLYKDLPIPADNNNTDLRQLGYWAPEQFEEETLPASDQYALAILFHDMLVGDVPWPGNNLQSRLASRLAGKPDLSRLSPEDRVVLTKALAPLPEDRFSSCTELVEHLRQADSQKLSGSIKKEAEALKAKLAEKKQQEEKAASTPSLSIPKLEKKQEEVAATPSSKPALHKEPKPLRKVSESLMEMELGLLATSNSEAGQVPSLGVLVPTLIIGAGGAGLSFIRSFAELMQDRFPELTSMPHLQLVGIDTDAEEISKVLQGKRTALKRDMLHHIPLYNPSDYLWPDLGLDHLQAWLPVNWVRVQERKATAEGRRVIGRLALSTHFSKIKTLVNKAVDQLLSPKTLQQSAAMTGLSIRPNAAPRVVVVGSLSGGTGSGMMTDLAYLVRLVCWEQGQLMPFVHGLALVPESGTDMEWANTYASLLEMQHFSGNRTYLASFSDTDELECAQPAFDELWLHGLTNTNETNSQLPTELVDLLLRDLLTGFGSSRDHARTLSLQAGEKKCRWVGVGFESYRSRNSDVTQFGDKVILNDMVHSWLEPDKAHQNVIEGELETYFKKLAGSPSQIVEALHEAATNALGKAPNQLIESWVSPLRKGAAARPPLGELARDIVRKIENVFGYGGISRSATFPAALNAQVDALSKRMTSGVSHIVLQWLERPGYRLGASQFVLNTLSEWADTHLEELKRTQTNLKEELVRTEKSLTQMQLEDRTFSTMGRQKIITQQAQDLLDYPAICFREDLLSRTISVYQKYREALDGLKDELTKGEADLKDCAKMVKPKGPENVLASVHSWLKQLPEESMDRLDAEFQGTLQRYGISFTDVALGNAQTFHDLVPMLENDIAVFIEENMPPADVALELLELSSQDVVKTLHNKFHLARPKVPLTRDHLSRSPGACLTITPATNAGQELQNLIQSAIPGTIVSFGEKPDEVVLYRESSGLSLEDLELEKAKEAYKKLNSDPHIALHTRIDVKWNG